MDHVVRGGEIESRAARPKADEKDVAAAALKGVHGTAARLRRRCAVQVLVGNALRVQILAQQGQVTRELAEDEGAVTVRPEVLYQLRKGIELGAGQLCPLEHEPGIAAGPAKPHEFRQMRNRRSRSSPTSCSMVSRARRRTDS